MAADRLPDPAEAEALIAHLRFLASFPVDEAKDLEDAANMLAAFLPVSAAVSPAEPPTKRREPIWALCCNCGAITLERTWTYWQRTEERDGWRPSVPGEGDPMCKCPACGWEHVDDDSNPGYYNGTREEMYAEHARIADDWIDHWAYTAEELDDAR